MSFAKGGLGTPSADATGDTGEVAQASAASSGQKLLVRRRLATALRMALAFASLYLVLLTLQVMVAGGAPLDLPIRIDSLTVRADGLAVFGRAMPGARVDYIVDGQGDGFAVADPNGQFADTIFVGRGHRNLAIQVSHPETRRVLFTWERSLARPLADDPPKLVMARRVPQIRAWWVAGTASPDAALRLSTAHDAMRTDVQTDSIGHFEVLVPWDTGSSRTVVARPMQPEEVDSDQKKLPMDQQTMDVRTLRSWDKVYKFFSDSMTVAEPRDTLLPLARRVEMNVVGDSTEMVAYISLPAEHPDVEALLRGNLDASDFADRVSGSSNFRKLDSPPAHLESSATANGEATVTIRGKRRSRPDEFLDVRPEDRGLVLPGGRGLVLPMFISRRDQVKAHVPGRSLRVSWGPVPQRLADQTITWEGGRPSESGLAVSFTLTKGTGGEISQQAKRTASTASTARADTSRQHTLGESIGRLDRFVQSESTLEWILRLTLGMLVPLIPFASVLWLWSRPPYRNERPWRMLAATALLFGVWRSWNYLLVLTQSVAATLTTRVFLPVQGALVSSQRVMVGGGLRGVEPGGARFEYSPELFSTDPNLQVFRAGRNVFLLLLVCAVATVPLYYDSVIALLSGAVPRQEARTWWRGVRRISRRVWTTLRVLYGTLAVIVLLQYVSAIPAMRRAPSDVVERIALANVPWMRLLHGRVGAHLAETFVLNDPQALTLVGVLLTAAVLLAFGARAALFAAAILVLAVYSACASSASLFWKAAGGERFSFIPPDMRVSVAELEWIAARPWPLVILVVGILSLPLVLGLLGALAPVRREHRALRWLIAALLVALALLLPRMPSLLLIFAAAALVFFGIAWVMLPMLTAVNIEGTAIGTIVRSPNRYLAAAMIAGVVLAIPVPVGQTDLGFTNLIDWVYYVQSVFAYLLAFGLSLELYRESRKSAPTAVRPRGRLVAALLFSVFVVNSSATWLYLPIQFLIGLLVAQHFLLRPEEEVSELLAAIPDPANQRDEIRALLERRGNRTQARAVTKELTSQLRKATLLPADYDAKRKAYVDRFGDPDARDDDIATRGVQAMFALGDAASWKRVHPAMKAGALLALFPIVVSMYGYVPHVPADRMFPLAQLVSFLLSGAASWLLYAFFFGFCYHYIRGDTGLGKGIRLSVAIAVPVLVEYLIRTVPTVDMTPFFLWVAQLFVFCSALGLFMDLQTLSRHGYGPRELRVMHDVPTLSAYGSTVVAATVPTVVALVQGKVTGIFNFLFKIFSRGGAGSTG